LRLSVDARHENGNVTNEQIRGDKYNEQDNTNIKGKALYKFGDEGTVLLSISDSNQDQKGRWLVDKFGQSVENTDAQAYSVEVDYPINRKWKFKLISSFANEDLDNLNDYDNDENADTGVGQVYKNSKSIEQEFRFNYKGDQLSSLIDLYYSQGEGQEDTTLNDAYYGSFIGTALYINEEVSTTEKFSNATLFLNTDYFFNRQVNSYL